MEEIHGLLLLRSTLQGYPAHLGISEMSATRADSGMSKHNTEATQTPCLTLLRQSASLPETTGPLHTMS
jgi:hypothetical protein